MDDIGQQARAIFGNSGNSLACDNLEDLPSDQVEYWLSNRSPHTPAAITLPSFSDPRIEAVQKQIREAETVQAIARLRLVWAEYQKRVFLEPPHFYWSMFMFRKRRTTNGKQASEAGGYYHKVAAS